MSSHMKQDMDRKDTLEQITGDFSQQYIPVKSGHRFRFNNVSLNPSTADRYQTAKIVTLATIPILTLIIQCGISLSNVRTDFETRVTIKTDILSSLETGNLVQNTQLERGMTALYLSSDGDRNIYEDLQRYYRNTDLALNGVTKWAAKLGNPAHFKTKETWFNHLKTFRNNIVINHTTINEVCAFYGENNDVIIDWLADSLQARTGEIWKTLVSYHMLLLSKEAHGMERAFAISFWGKGPFSQEDYLSYVELNTLGRRYLQRSQQYRSKVISLIEGRLSESNLASTLKKMRQKILKNDPSHQPSVSSGIHWFGNMTAYINILKYTQDSMGKDIISNLDTETKDLRTSLIVSIMIMVTVLLLFPTITYVVFRQTNKLQVYATSLHEKTNELEVERKRTEALLYQMLPISVAKKLMRNERVHPSIYKSATVYFSDIVGFTTICSNSSPLEVVDMLNLLYKTFDNRLERYDVYKVETIGDAYLVVSGLPQTNSDRHVLEISNMALDILQTISFIRVPQLPLETLRVRIGINTGPVVAGVVGYKMPRYCVFGDTVNVASRMESTGQPQKIQISASTNEALKKFAGCITQERGDIAIKGKGMMKTYWLLQSPDMMHTPDVDPPAPESFY